MSWNGMLSHAQNTMAILTWATRTTVNKLHGFNTEQHTENRQQIDCVKHIAQRKIMIFVIMIRQLVDGLTVSKMAKTCITVQKRVSNIYY